MTRMLELEPSARRLAGLLDAVADDHLAAPTPCAEYSVGDLLDHLVGLTREFRDAARKVTRANADGTGPSPPSAANLARDWRTRLPRQLDELAAAWKEPAAWEGMTTAGGVTLPAEVMGLVALDELVLHGWDLARATDQPYDVDAASARACYEFTRSAAAPARATSREGLFGPVVEVPDDAPLFHQALGLSGRRPDWRPPTRPPVTPRTPPAGRCAGWRCT